MTVDPAVEVETGSSEVHAVVQVSGPTFAGETVTVDSTQLQGACVGGFAFETLQGGSVSAPVTGASLSVVLDTLGRATVSVSASLCAPGISTIDATLASSPFTSASTKLTVDPPQPAAPGLSAFPTSEVETSGGDVYAVFDVGMNRSFSGDTVSIDSAQLGADCVGVRWEPGNGGTATTSGSAEATLDQNGNAVFVVEGSSCGAFPSVVQADLDAPPFTTYGSDFTIVSEVPAITKFTPSRGRAGKSVTITGSSLSGATAVTFNGTPAVIIRDDATKIKTQVPSGATTGTIQVTTPGGTATSATPFTVT